MLKNIATQFPSLILSLFHPIIIIFYFLIILLFCSSIGDNTAVAFNFKLSVIAHVSLMTILLPTLLILGFRSVLKRLNYSFTKNQTTFYLLIMAISYLITMFATISYLGSMIAQKIFLTSAVTLTIASVFVKFFPLSLHLLAIAMLTTLIVGAQILGYGNFEVYIALLVIIAGLVATCQLYLQKFSLLQTFYSYLLGLFLMALLLKL